MHSNNASTIFLLKYICLFAFFLAITNTNLIENHIYIGLENPDNLTIDNDHGAGFSDCYFALINQTTPEFADIAATQLNVKKNSTLLHRFDLFTHSDLTHSFLCCFAGTDQTRAMVLRI